MGENSRLPTVDSMNIAIVLTVWEDHMPGFYTKKTSAYKGALKQSTPHMCWDIRQRPFAPD